MLLVAFSCAPAPAAPPRTEPLPIGQWPRDTTYFTLGEEPTILLGFDLRGQPIDTKTFNQLIKQLAASGGNYLALDGDAIDEQQLYRYYGLGYELGVRIDTTSHTGPLAVAGSVAQFSASVLRGAPAVGYRQPVQAALNSFRAVRTVERHLRFWNLDEDPLLLGEERPAGTAAAADSAGNYLVYIPTEGAVTLRFRDSLQSARRVTVVGHLGTQRSEVLQPPYDRSFTLRSNEPLGGWLIVEQLE